MSEANEVGLRLHMLRLDPDLTRVVTWGASHGVAQPGVDDGYLWHAILKAAFGDFAPRPFRFVAQPGNAGTAPHLLAYTRHDGTELRAHAEAFADPAVVEALNLTTMAIKTMPARFTFGRRLGFEVRLRPVVRQSLAEDRTRHREIDVFVQVASRNPDAPRPERLEVYSDWLARLLQQGGARLETARLVAQRRARILRRGKAAEDGKRALAAHGRKGGGPDIVMVGQLSVEEPPLFSELLACGVGRHRAFGFGMLLLRPPEPG